MKNEQTLSPEMTRKVHQLLAEDDSPFARACLRMMDEGTDINAAAAAEGTDLIRLMRQ